MHYYVNHGMNDDYNAKIKAMDGMISRLVTEIERIVEALRPEQPLSQVDALASRHNELSDTLETLDKLREEFFKAYFYILHTVASLEEDFAC